jgi:homoserine kinase type II
MDVTKANELFELAKRLAADTQTLRDALQVEFLSSQLAEVVASDYDLGEVLRVEQILGGYTNLSFAVVVATTEGEKRYFVRKYNPLNTEREVQFEHALVNHISGKGFHIAARVYPSKAGGTYVKRDEIVDGETVTRLYAVYEMLVGEDKYTWISNRLTDKEYESGARVLARFHALAHDFDPGELAREQPPIMEFVAQFPEIFAAYAARSRDTEFDHFYLEKLPAILDVVRAGQAIAGLLQGMPRVPVHCDYHPGNLKWVDEEGVGLFDFDWSKLDYRLFDVAQGIVYFCSSWEGADDGEVRLDKAAIFVRAYQDEAARFDVPGPMSAEELALLPRMVANANLYILNWDLMAYYEDPSVDVVEYMMYLGHQVHFMEYIEAHLDELAHIVPPGTAPHSGQSAGGEEA